MPDEAKDGHRINLMYAFIAIDEDGDEGVCAMYTPEGWVPMVGSDMERVDTLRKVAAGIARRSGKIVHLRRFSNMEIVNVIHPSGVGA